MHIIPIDIVLIDVQKNLLFCYHGQPSNSDLMTLKELIISWILTISNTIIKSVSVHLGCSADDKLSINLLTVQHFCQFEKYGYQY